MVNSRLTRWLTMASCVVAAFSAAANAGEKAPRQQLAARDVALQADGVLVGRLLDSQGRAIDGAVVTLSQADQVLGQTTTDAKGEYKFADAKSGVYRVSAAHVSKDFRAWPTTIAPPGAQKYATLVETSGVVRGQIGAGNLGTIVGIGAGVTGAVVGGIALDKANDAEDEAAELRAIINALSP